MCLTVAEFKMDQSWQWSKLLGHSVPDLWMSEWSFNTCCQYRITPDKWRPTSAAILLNDHPFRRSFTIFNWTKGLFAHLRGIANASVGLFKYNETNPSTSSYTDRALAWRLILSEYRLRAIIYLLIWLSYFMVRRKMMILFLISGIHSWLTMNLIVRKELIYLSSDLIIWECYFQNMCVGVSACVSEIELTEVMRSLHTRIYTQLELSIFKHFGLEMTPMKHGDNWNPFVSIFVVEWKKEILKLWLFVLELSHFYQILIKLIIITLWTFTAQSTDVGMFF